MAEELYYKVETVRGSGVFDKPVLLTGNKTPGTIAFHRKPPFVLSTDAGKAIRMQGVPIRKTRTDFERLVYYRLMGLAGEPAYREDLQVMYQKGYTHLRGDNFTEAEMESFAFELKGFNYGNLGINDTAEQVDHNPAWVTTASLQECYDFLNVRIPVFPARIDRYIGNYEYHHFWSPDGDKQPACRSYWANLAGSYKSKVFRSYYDGQSRSLQQIYDAAGGGDNGLAAVDNHLHPKRRVFIGMLLRILKKKNPHMKVTNGDELYYKTPNPNGSIVLGGVERSLLAYKTFAYNELKEIDGFSTNTIEAGTFTASDGTQLNLSGHMYECYDFFNNYYYYFNFYVRESDWNEINNNPAKRSVDEWQKVIFPDRTAIYGLAVCYTVREHFFSLHKTATGTDYGAKPWGDMFEQMLEGEVRLVPDNVNKLDCYSDTKVNSFYPWVGEGSQKVFIPRQLVYIRNWLNYLLSNYIFQWWEGRPQGYSGMGINLGEGKYKYLHNRVIEWDQQAHEEIAQYGDAFGGGSVLEVCEGINYRYKIGTAAWSAFSASRTIMDCAYGKNGGAWDFKPALIRASVPGGAQLTVAIHWQMDTDTLVEYYDKQGALRTIFLQGYQPALSYVNPLINQQPLTGTPSQAIVSSFNTLQRLTTAGTVTPSNPTPTDTDWELDGAYEPLTSA